MSKSGTAAVLAAAHAAVIIALGYVLLGLVPMLLFTSGFVGGLAIWLGSRDRASFGDIGIPYFLTLAFFVLHKIEEREMDFFPALSNLTGVPLPQEGSPLAVLLLWLFPRDGERDPARAGRMVGRMEDGSPGVARFRIGQPLTL